MGNTVYWTRSDEQELSRDQLVCIAYEAQLETCSLRQVSNNGDVCRAWGTARAHAAAPSGGGRDTAAERAGAGVTRRRERVRARRGAEMLV